MYLDLSHVLLGRKFGSKREVVEAIGKVMVSCGDVTPRYAEAMLLKEEKFSTWITDGVALPHGTNEAKGEVNCNSVVIVQIPEGVDWGGGKTVQLAIGVAGRGEDQHVKMLTAVARILQDRACLARLLSVADAEEVLRILEHRFP